VEYEIARFGFAHQRVGVVTNPVARRAPKAGAELPSGPAVEMLPLSGFYIDAAVVGIWLKHRAPYPSQYSLYLEALSLSKLK
jgi:hypothetical protein